MVTIPKQLEWARSLQAIAQNGLAYGEPHEYDRERYEQVRRIAAEMLTGDDNAVDLDAAFAREIGYATPKLDVRGVAFDGDGILLVRDRAEGWWTIPGGWADVGESPGDAVSREVLEESGYNTRAVKLLAMYDRNRHEYEPHQWHVWNAIFLCELNGAGAGELGYETDQVGFFEREALPEPLYAEGMRRLIGRAFEHKDNPEWPADFD